MKRFMLFALTMALSLSACSKKEEKVEKIDEVEIPQVQTEIKETAKPIVKAPEAKPEVKKKKIYSNYSGKEASEKDKSMRPFMVMIDNHPNARPQSSLSKASIIWEMRVEGGFTRYMALFEPSEKDDFLIGPVRSARPNFVTIANQYDGIYFHHGGSKDGLNLIYYLGLKEYDGMALEGSLFFRYFDTGKYAPHNSYINMRDAMSYAKSYGWQELGEVHPFKFNQEAKDIIGGDNADKIYLTYDPTYSSITYTYNPETKLYDRYRQGVQMLDEASGDPVRASNIIIEIADSYVYDNAGHKAFNTIGQGKGYLATNGKIKEIKWSKSDDHINPTKFTDLEGKEIVLNPGQTWIQVIDSFMHYAWE